MSAGNAKQKVLEVIEKLPADATLEDAIERLVLLAKTERGLAELDAGQGVDHAEAKRRFSGDPGHLGRILWAALTRVAFAVCSGFKVSPAAPAGELGR